MGNEVGIKFLGIAKKAGKLEIGEESCGVAARDKKARVILTASDSSDNARRRADYFSTVSAAPHIGIPYTKEQLGREIGRGTPGMLAVTDIGIAASFVSKLASAYPGKYDEAAGRLAEKAEKMALRKREALSHEKNVRMGKRRTNK